MNDFIVRQCKQFRATANSHELLPCRIYCLLSFLMVQVICILLCICMHVCREEYQKHSIAPTIVLGQCCAVAAPGAVPQECPPVSAFE